MAAAAMCSGVPVDLLFAVIVLVVVAALLVAYCYAATRALAHRAQHAPVRRDLSHHPEHVGAVSGGGLAGRETRGGAPADAAPSAPGAPPPALLAQEDGGYTSGMVQALLKDRLADLGAAISTRTHPDHMVQPRVDAQGEHAVGGDARHADGDARHADDAADGADAEDGAQRINDASRRAAASAKKAAARPWTEYRTWEKLRKDKAAMGRYHNDVFRVMNEIPPDWSALRAAAAPLLADDREWAGLINVIDGVPTIVEKVPSPTKVGETTRLNVSAEVPVEVIDKLSTRPAYYMFHTHPDKVVSPQLVSTADILLAVTESFFGHYAANAMVSSTAIVLYGMYKEPLDRIFAAEHPYLEFTQYCLDVYGALTGLRSRQGTHSIRDFTTVLEQFGIFHIVLPTDGYANLYYNTVYSYPRNITDIDSYERQLKLVEGAQAEAYPDTKRAPPGAAA